MSGAIRVFGSWPVALVLCAGFGWLGWRDGERWAVGVAAGFAVLVVAWPLECTWRRLAPRARSARRERQARRSDVEVGGGAR